MRYLIHLGTVMVCFGLLAGCNRSVDTGSGGSGTTTSEPVAVQVLPTVSSPIAITPTPDSTAVIQVESPVAVALTPTLAAVTLTEGPITAKPAGWQTFTDLTGIVELEYPAGWSIVRTDSGPATESFVFMASNTEAGTNAIARISVSIEQAGREVYSTHYAPGHNVPNEGGYEPYWETPLSAPDASGVLYVVGQNPESCPNCSALILANYFTEIHGFVVSIGAYNFPDNLRQEAETNGLEATITEHFPVFDHVMRSIRFAKP